MTDADYPSNEEFEKTNSAISEGLKSCRAVVCGYRALLSAELNPDGASGNEDFPDTNRDEKILGSG